ncbi:hypothetical protein C2G38_2054027 [Gigaspora rosea]|uniref:Uncharacterized protein n=1 Tax=Gigaspora rosea TaxID=44941 RepID=A0A397W885_9GLOM|nr:hypothetical protein C2G38_2054027 [Gigaspora rosea]CAG8634106.1 13187_t:CDS:2 [Gigaspora rosea]
MKAISDVKNISNHNNTEKYYKKIDKQLNYFKEFDKKALNIGDFIHMIDSAFSLIKELKNMNLNSADTSSNEANLVDKIDQYLHNWIKEYAKIAQKFTQFYEGLSIFNKNNKNDAFVLFNIQEELLTEVDDIRKHLTKKSKELGNILYLNKEDIKKKIEKDLHRIIQLKSVYDLTTELENIRSRLELFDPNFIQKISDFCEKLTYNLELNNDLIKIFRENEPYVKDYCLNCIVKNLAEISCLVNHFCRCIIAKTYDKAEFEIVKKY